MSEFLEQIRSRRQEAEGRPVTMTPSQRRAVGEILRGAAERHQVGVLSNSGRSVYIRFEWAPEARGAVLSALSSTLPSVVVGPRGGLR